MFLEVKSLLIYGLTDFYVFVWFSISYATGYLIFQK